MRLIKIYVPLTLGLVCVSGSTLNSSEKGHPNIVEQNVSTQLETANLTAPDWNDTFEAFPPGRFPPRRTLGYPDYVYFVPSADPPMRMSFRPIASNLWRRDRRSEDGVIGALLLALSRATTEPAEQNLDQDIWNWRVGSQAQEELALEVTHDTAPESPGRRRTSLTWKIWRNAIVVLQEFVTTYPGVNVHFEIFLTNVPYPRGLQVGTGAIQSIPPAPASPPSVGCDSLQGSCQSSDVEVADQAVVEVS